jgi:hypothetical protein
MKETNTNYQDGDQALCRHCRTYIEYDSGNDPEWTHETGFADCADAEDGWPYAEPDESDQLRAKAWLDLSKEGVIPLDHCPTCGKRILDTDDEGLEDGTDGQRWCRAHRYPIAHDCGFKHECSTPRPDRLFEDSEWSGYCQHLVGAGPCQYCDDPAYIAFLEDSQQAMLDYLPDYDTRREEAQEALAELFLEQHPPCWWIPVATMERTSR